jgi:peptidoglycan/LPS O-acetylase OafA/YrhL
MPALLLILRSLSVWTNDAFAFRMAATHLRLDALLFGVGVRAVAYQWPDWFAAVGAWRRSLVAIGIVLWLPHFFVDPAMPIIRTLGLTGNFIGAAAFLIAAYHTHTANFRVSLPVVSPIASFLGWIGVYSYAIYLWHVTTIGILERVVGQRALAYFGESSGLAWLVSAIIITAGAIVVWRACEPHRRMAGPASSRSILSLSIKLDALA